MAEMENFSTINENFDTIKTLLNSIRAQGILNTSDVDKLLSGINSKLEKINTEEDIDLIKIFLSELKQNLDERHSVLLSKFGAIESLFTNVLKNSAELPKSAELKELFDIVATNLSVFSREVVSQKETLTDITLRLDALRSDDSQKKDIIKNITLLKSDIERLNNGFDSIVISLNDNFKTVVKTITSIDKTEHLDNFASVLNNIEMSSNTLLSAIQMLDKKTESVDSSLQNLATKGDLTSANQRLVDISAQNQEISMAVSDLAVKFIRMDSLADKIDASVNIVASLKTVFEDVEENNTSKLLDELKDLESLLNNISTEANYESFKLALENILNKISENADTLDKYHAISNEEISNLIALINGLELDLNFKALLSSFGKTESEIKSYINEHVQRITNLNDANITRVLNDLSSSADSLSARLNQTQSSLAILCEKHFGLVFEHIAEVKSVISQLDENSVSANNAIFSSITDRLTIFENSLRKSLDNQEKTLSLSAAQLVEQVETLKNISNVLDYKMDSSIVEMGNVKREFDSLKTAVENILALDFVTTVKDLRLDLYASKQEMVNAFETANSDLSDKFTNDLYGKYELLISKLDSVEDEFKKNQYDSLNYLKQSLDNVSSSLVDILSYVSEEKSGASEILDSRIAVLTESLKENGLSYVENVRDVVDVIRVQLDNNIKNLEVDLNGAFDNVKKAISDNSEDIKKELKYSYAKLLEMQDSYNEIKESINLNNINTSDKFDGILSATDNIKTEFETKLLSLKNSMLDKITDFKQEFSIENADKLSEIKFAVESLYTKNTNELLGLVENLRDRVSSITTEESVARTETLTKIIDNFTSLKDMMSLLNEQNAETVSKQAKLILEDVATVKTLLNKVDEEIDGDLTRQLSIIESNFESLVSQISILFDKSDRTLVEKLNQEFNQMSNMTKELLIEKLDSYKAKIEKTFDTLNEKTIEQSNYLQERIADLNTTMKSVFMEQAENNNTHIKNVSDSIKSILDNNIEKSDLNYNSLKDSLELFAKNLEENNKVLANDINTQFEDITKYINSVIEVELEKNSKKLDLISDGINNSEESIKTSLTQLSEKNTTEFNSVSDKLENLQDRITSEFVSFTDKTTSEFENLSDNVVNLQKEVKQDFVNFKTEVSNNLQNSQNQTESTVIDLKAEIIRLFKNSDSDIKTAFSTLNEAINERLNLNRSESVNDISELQTAISEQLNLTQQQANEVLNTIRNEFVDSIKSAKDKTHESISSLNTQLSEDIEKSSREISSILSSVKEVIDEKFNISQQDAKDALATIMDEIAKQLVYADDADSDLKMIAKTVTNNSNKIEDIESLIKTNHDQAISNTASIESATDLIQETLTNNTELITSVKTDLVLLAQAARANNQLVTDFQISLQEKVQALQTLSAEISAGELQTLDVYIENLTSLIESEKQYIEICKNAIVDLLNKELKIISGDIEKETDVIITELIEQFDIMKSVHSDEIVKLTTSIEDIVNAHLYDSIEDLKSYLDIKTDNSVSISKLDNLKNELSDGVESIITDLNKLLNIDLFTASISDFRAANEIFINSAIDRLNDKFTSYITDNFENLNTNLESKNKSIEDKLELFDKKFVDLVVDKYEEIKLLSLQHKDSFNDLQKGFEIIIEEFKNEKSVIVEKFDSLSKTLLDTANSTNSEIRLLSESFKNLRSQISNKSFDEAFQASINKQIGNLESLVTEQLNYIEDINELCVNNLPDITELNILVKHSIVDTIKNFSEKLNDVDAIEDFIEAGFKQVKSDIITQLLNIFNQISFVAEQEEILDFIQEKHDELITILSHIVTTSETVTIVDNKIDSIKEDIEIINDKISAIISSSGDIDYVYSLQDLESDIANLRVVLNEIKDGGHSSELSDLINSTNEIYNFVESLKENIPTKNDFDTLSEDIVSISSRTNKLILASDESYKTLQDNLQDFKLVINDLDERTRNFAKESGMDKIDSKLNAINSMMQNGAKTNQVFNQVFEYLAEWVDKAGIQIESISKRVDNLNEIDQIKSMLTELKEGAADNTETVELVEALGAVFDKQNKRISSLETKLDKIIVETTLINQNHKLDLVPMEETLNKFLVAMDEKISSQQTKINSLETSLQGVLELLEEKDTAQLTKKVGGMDRQIAKLNKSIEKIASHVVEK